MTDSTEDRSKQDGHEGEEDDPTGRPMPTVDRSIDHPNEHPAGQSAVDRDDAHGQ